MRVGVFVGVGVAVGIGVNVGAAVGIGVEIVSSSVGAPKVVNTVWVL